MALRHLLETTNAAGAAVATIEDGNPRILRALGLKPQNPLLLEALGVALATLAEARIYKPQELLEVEGSETQSILCVPIRRQGKTKEAVYLERREATPFNDVDLRVAASFSAILGLAFELTLRRERAEQSAEEARAVAAHTRGFWRFGAIATHNSRFADCLRLAERVARSDSTVLLFGETGVGKEHMAHCIHAESSRRNGPFIVVNCAAIPESLLESELFGHEKGAFTGATQSRRGKFELAHGGTLFLDEIGEMPLHLQPKLLRVLEEKCVTRVGAAEERAADARILAATNRDLTQEVQAGRFREDLFYRLNVVALTLPPLRERTEDIPALAEAFLKLESARLDREMRWSEEALKVLSLHPWPGNVRELRNFVEKLSVLSDEKEIDGWTVELHFGGPSGGAPEPAAKSDNALQERLRDAERVLQDLQRTINELRPNQQAPQASEPLPLSATTPSSKSFHDQMNDAAREILARTIRQHRSISGAARVLGLSRQHVSLKCKTLGLKSDLGSPGVGESNGDGP